MEQVKASIVDAFARGDQRIRVAGTVDNPWFCGNDVAAVLGYADARHAVKRHVDENDKMTYSALLLTRQETTSRIVASSNERKSIYINESGLYSLTLQCKLPRAREFKRWVTAELLPSIRKNGYYVAKDIESKQLEELKAQLEEREVALEESKKALEEKEKIIRSKEKRIMNLSCYMDNFKPLPKTQVFYIATTAVYAAQNRYKFGGVRTERDMLSRLHSYNTGRAEGDLFFFVKMLHCNNYKLIEERVHNVLGQFKDKRNGRKEMLYLRYDQLERTIDFIAENYDKEIEFINEHCREFLEDTIETEDAKVPAAIELGTQLEVTLRRGGRVKRQFINVDELSDEQADELFQKLVTTCIRKDLPDYDFGRDCNQVPAVLSWSKFAPLLKEHSPKMTPWRVVFKKWYRRTRPRLLKLQSISPALEPPSVARSA